MTSVDLGISYVLNIVVAPAARQEVAPVVFRWDLAARAGPWPARKRAIFDNYSHLSSTYSRASVYLVGDAAYSSE